MQNIINKPFCAIYIIAIVRILISSEKASITLVTLGGVNATPRIIEDGKVYLKPLT